MLTGVSSYVANTLPASFSLPAKGFASPASPAFPTHPSSPYFYPATQGSSNALLGNHQDNLCVLTTGDVVQFSAFDWIETTGSARSRSSRYVCVFVVVDCGYLFERRDSITRGSIRALDINPAQQRARAVLCGFATSEKSRG